jgi:disulfide oxidoreductase YuzD
VFVHNHGEQALMNILENLALNKQNPRILQVPIKDLSILPSPYLSGLFTEIMEKEKIPKIRAVLETNRGCPFLCTFCDWGDLAYNKVGKFPLEKVMAEIKWFSDNKIKLVNIADANIGMFKDRDESILKEIVKLQLETGYPKVLDGAWYKNAHDRVLDLAKITTAIPNNKSYTLSVQTLNPKTSEAIKRKNIPTEKMIELLSDADKAGVRSYTEFILGLPFETTESWIDGYTSILEAGQHSHIEAWFLQILDNSELGTEESIIEHEMETVQVHNYIGAVGQFDDIDEEYRVVRSTKYMPFDDLVESYMFSWLIINFHIKGWTQVYSRFNRKYLNQSFKEFYADLFDKIKNDNGAVGQEYNRLRSNVETYLTTGKVDFWVPGNSLLYDSTKYLFQKSDEVKEFVKQMIDIEDKKLEEQVIKLQDMYTATPFREYPAKLELDYNLPEYITRSDPLVQSTVTYDANLPDTKYLRSVHEQQLLEEWYSMLYYRSKTGWGKTNISKNNISYLR